MLQGEGTERFPSDRRWEGDMIDEKKGKSCRDWTMAEEVKTREMSRSSDLEAVSLEDVPRSAEDVEMSDVHFGNS